MDAYESVLDEAYQHGYAHGIERGADVMSEHLRQCLTASHVLSNAGDSVLNELRDAIRYAHDRAMTEVV